MLSWLFYNIVLWGLSNCLGTKWNFSNKLIASILILGICFDAIWSLFVLLEVIQHPTPFAIPVQIIK